MTYRASRTVYGNGHLAWEEKKIDPLAFRKYRVVATLQDHPDVEHIEGLVRANPRITPANGKELEVEFLSLQQTGMRGAVLVATRALEEFFVLDLFVQDVTGRVMA